jgi:hypothetical protein
VRCPSDSTTLRDQKMSVLIDACVVLAITSCAAGCATVPSASDQVRVTNAPADVEGCNLLGKGHRR